MKPLVYKKSRVRAERREPERHKMHIAKGDTVRVISGEHRGKEGKVLRVFPTEFRVEVEGVNIVKKHKRATNPNDESGIIELTARLCFFTMFTPSTSTRNSVGNTRSTFPSLPRCSPEITRTVSPFAMCILWRSGSRRSARTRLFL